MANYLKDRHAEIVLRLIREKDTLTPSEETVLYNELKPALTKLISSLITKFNLDKSEKRQYLEHELLSHVSERMYRFKPERLNKKGHTSSIFSFLNVVCQNRLIHLLKRENLVESKSVSLDAIHEKVTKGIIQASDTAILNQTVTSEFIGYGEDPEDLSTFVLNKLKSYTKTIKEKKNKEYYSAVCEIFANRDVLALTNSKDFYVLVRKLTKLKRSEILFFHPPLAKFYDNAKFEYLNGYEKPTGNRTHMIDYPRISPISRIDSAGNVSNEFKTLTDAAKFIKCHMQTLSNMMNGTCPRGKSFDPGFTWSYKGITI